MSYAGAEAALVGNWISATLLADATLVGLVSTKVFEDLAPNGTPFPYVVFNVQDAPYVVRGVGLAEVMVDTIFTVKAVAQVSSYDVLAPHASAIRAALVTAETQAPTGGLIFTCSYERQVAYAEGRGAEQVRHLGGEYKIQAQPS